MIRMFQITLLILISALGAICYGQTQPSTQPSTPGPPPQTVKAALGFGLEDGTPVRMRISRTISSADAKVGERVDFEVLDDVKYGETIIIPRGGTAVATITEAVPKRRLARGGKLNVNIDNVRLVSGEKAALRAVKEVSGDAHTAAMTGAIVATSIVFFPAAPIFLFIKGKDIVIPKGTEITAYINGDISLDPNKFGQTARSNEQVAASTPPESQAEQAFFVDPEFSSVTIKSTPFGADITIDGKFAGNTPSTLRLKSGDHKISIKQPGYVLWERTITLSAGGNITVNANLEK